MYDTSSPPNSWYDPPEQHEIDGCQGCHDEGHHDNPREFPECSDCVEEEKEDNESLSN